MSQSAASVQRAAGFSAFTSLARVGVKASRSSFAQPLPSLSPHGAHFFISDAADESVDLYKYDPLGLLKTIGGFNEPQGMCSHKKTAWLANTGASNLVHLNAGGKVIGTLADPGQYPVGCALDKQGDLAVANIISTSGGAGSVSIWTDAKGNPTSYPVAGLSRVYFIAYDPHGDLFVDGANASGVFELAERAKGQSAFTTVTVSGATINFPGSLQYADGALAVGDQSGSSGHSVIYQTHVSGETATVVGATQLADAIDAVSTCITPFATIIVGDAGSGDIQIYAYPAGGKPIHTISGGGSGGCAFIP